MVREETPQDFEEGTRVLGGGFTGFTVEARRVKTGPKTDSAVNFIMSRGNGFTSSTPPVEITLVKTVSPSATIVPPPENLLRTGTWEVNAEGLTSFLIFPPIPRTMQQSGSPFTAVFGGE